MICSHSLNGDLPRHLVKPSARWYFVSTCVGTTTRCSTRCLKKWMASTKCLLLLVTPMLWAISIAALLSTQITVGHVIGNPKSTSTLRTKTSSLHAYDAAAYSAFC